jgi:hypothetical protein
MNGNIRKISIAALISIGVFISCVTFAEALDAKLLWKKEFKNASIGVDFADKSGDLLITKGKKDNVTREVILYDKDGNERFHWGPRMDRRVGVATISNDGKHFVFSSGYTEEYAEKKKVAAIWGELLHFYDRQTKKELWNTKIGEESPKIFPDGLSVIVYGYETGMFNIYNRQGKISFEQNQQLGGMYSIKISPDSNYFAFINGANRGSLILYKRDGTKQWEKGYHSEIASISAGASYISTFPYTLGPSSTADELNSHKGMVCDRNGNKVMEGFGVLSGSASKIAMLYRDKVSVLNWPNKTLVKEIMIDMREVFETSSSSHTRFSNDGRYLFLKSGISVKVYDLLENTNKEIKIPEMVEYPIFFATEDGKYLLINPYGTEQTKTTTIYFYQIY